MDALIRCKNPYSESWGKNHFLADPENKSLFFLPRSHIVTTSFHDLYKCTEDQQKPHDETYAFCPPEALGTPWSFS